MPVDEQAFLGRGWAFPIPEHQEQPNKSVLGYLEVDRGRIAAVSGAANVEQSIFLILSTAPGERVMRPDFGCGIHTLVFRAINTALLAQVQRLVTESLRRYEPRIEVTQVTIDQRDALRGRLGIAVDYFIRDTNQTGNFVYPFYFKEGS